jgi:Hemerythrin HHE cation binding domain
MTTTTQSDLQEFTDGFRNEHRAGRDTFLAIGQALRARDTARIGELMGRANTLIGPHMQYEEEVMYPELAVLFGEEYVARMLADHDRAFTVAATLMEIASKSEITDADIEAGNTAIRHLLPHVTDCDGLVLAVEVLPTDAQQRIFAARHRAFEAGTTMMEWGARRGR